MTAAAMGETMPAAEFLQQAIALNPKHLAATLTLSELFARSSHKPTIEEGRRLAQSALTVTPENAKALNILGILRDPLQEAFQP